MGWRLTKVVPERAVTGEVIWQYLRQGGGQWLSSEAVSLLPTLPNYVEYASLWSEGQLLVRTGIEWQPVVMEKSVALVWDGCLQFHPSYRLAVTGMPRDTDYRDHLVRQYNFLDTVTGTRVGILEPAFFWVPTPQSGFIPSITSQ